MTRALSIVAFLALPALAAKPAFIEVAKRFPPVTLPLDSKRLPSGTALSVEEVPALGFVGRSEKAFGPLRMWEPEPEGGTVERVLAVGSFRRGDVTVLVLRYTTQFDLGSFSADYLLTYSAQGALLDGHEFAVDASSEAGSEKTEASLTADGALSRRTERKVPMMEEGLPEQLVVRAESTARLLPSGRFQVSPPAFVTKDGAFIDQKSKEELRVFGDDIFYRGKPQKPFQRLLREGDAVRFKAGGKPYLLSWADARGAITCKNPDGTKQTFTREW